MWATSRRGDGPQGRGPPQRRGRPRVELGPDPAHPDDEHQPPPRGGTCDDLIRDTKHGIYFETNKSWSIDDRRVNFQFGTEIAWEIQGGRKARILKNPLYTGITPQFWGSCVAIAGPEEWHMWGVPNCGKGSRGG